MKALLARIPYTALRLVAAAFVIIICFAALMSTASVASPGHTGQALALRAMLQPGLSPADAERLANSRRGPGLGHFAQVRNTSHSPLRAFATGTTPAPVLISEGVQTYDVFAGPPAFQPGDGPLTPTNLTPIWTSDDSEIIFSSNRAHTAPGGAANVSDGTFHLWSISSKGDSPSSSTLHQITTSSGNEFFPTLTTDNSRLAFTSTAGNGTSNLYVVGSFSATQTAVDVTTLTSLTIRPDLTNGTGFGEVDRPTFDPSGQRLAFSARDIGGPYVGKRHIWFLYTNSGGAFSAVRPSFDNPPGKLTNGPGDDTDPAWAPGSANLIAFASTASGITSTTQAPQTTTTPAATPTRSLFVISGTGSNGTQLTNVSGNAPVDDFAPAWNYNTTLSPGIGYLAFAQGASPSSLHDIYYVQAYTINPNTGAATPQPGNFVRQFNTDDNGGVSGNQYDDIYPSWTNVQTATSITYASNRSVTYNDPLTGKPVETAISLPQAPLVAGVPAPGDVGPTYSGVLVSLFDDVDPPTLLPYSSGEVIHVTDGTANPTDPTLKPRRNGDIVPGKTVTFTVRLSNRESGVDDNNVYLQIKDPDSKYQDAQGLEHKVFTKDTADFLRNPDSFASTFIGTKTTPAPMGSPPGTPPTVQDEFVGSATASLYNGGVNFGFFDPNNPEGLDASYTSPGTAQESTTVNKVTYFSELRGAVGGMDGALPITVGHLAGNPNPPPATTPPTPTPNPPGTNPVSAPNTATPPVTKPLTGGDPANYTVFGQEYECQFINPQFNGFSGTGDTDPTNPAKYYGTPFYLAGVDDQQPHEAFLHPPRPTANNGSAPAEWLQMTRVANQDSQGGVLYSVTWTTPLSASDFYLDVIAYDKANFNNFPAQNTGFGTPSFFANFRIYDNIWGFSTEQFSGSNNILVVSDNTLGQKFVSATSFVNIPPIFYGAESYYTDIDLNLLPNTVYRSVPAPKGSTNTVTGKAPGDGLPVAQLFPIGVTDFAQYHFRNAVDTNGNNYTQFIPVLNGLGVGSYNEIGTAATTIDGVSVSPSQQYNIWRILSRGPLSPDVLATYEPKPVSQPAVTDPLTGFTAPATTVSDAQRCVIWVSPYAGDLPLNVIGSIADTDTQTELRNFVNAGGRLFVSGGHIASAVSLGGAVPALNGPGSFLTDVLNASLVPNTGGSEALSAGGGIGARISGDAYFNANLGLLQTQDFYTTVTTNGLKYTTPNSLPLILGNDYERFPGNPSPNFGLWRTDGSLDQLGPVQSSIGNSTESSQIDIITPQNNATTDIGIAGPGYAVNTFGTGPGLIYREGIGANGGRVVFSSFGLEGIGIEYYKFTANMVDTYYAHNQRPNILHNVVTYLRTGTVIGKVTAGSSGGQNLGGATVYLQPNTGTLPASGPTTFSATTAPDGTYRIAGVEPGSYIAVAYRTGYTRTISNTPKTVPASGSASFNLNLIPVPPGSISGMVTDASNNNVGLGNATVTFTSTDGLSTVSGTTNPDGTYTVNNVPTGVYNGTATKSGYTTALTTSTVNVQSSATTPNINFSLSFVPGTLGGLVQDDSNPSVPVAGATVTFSDKPLTDPTAKILATVTTTTPATRPSATPVNGAVTGDGNPLNFTAALMQGTYYVTVTPPVTGYIQTPTPFGPFTVSSNGFIRVPTVTLTSTLGTLGGIVTDAATGQPLGNATVTISEGGNTVASFPVNGATTVSSGQTGDGQPVNYSQTLTHASDYTVSVSAPNRVTQTISNVQITTHHFTREDFALVSTVGTLGGLVVDSYNNQPLGGATVTITDANGNAVAGSPFTTTTATITSPPDANGKTYQINYGPVSLPFKDVNGTPIRYSVSVTAPNFTAPPAQNVTGTPAKFNPVNFAPVSNLASLGGLVTDAANPGVPLDGATVTVTANGATVYTTTTSGSTTSQAVRGGNTNPINYGPIPSLPVFDANGNLIPYTIKVVKIGAGTAAKPDYLTQTQTVTLSPNKFQSQPFALVVGYGTLGGLVSDAKTGQPIVGATITVTDSTGNTVATINSRGTQTSPGAPTGNGQPQNYNVRLYQGTYTVSVAATNFTTLSGIMVIVNGSAFTQQNFALSTTQGTLGGLVNDSFTGQPVGGVSVTVTDTTTNKSLATFTTSATTTPAPDGGAQNYGGMLTQGTYSVALTRRGYNIPAAQTVTVTAGQFVRLDFTGANGLTPIHVFGAGYNFFSVPYDYASLGVGFDDIFGVLNTGTFKPLVLNPSNANRSHVFVWNPQIGSYASDPTAPADSLRLGQGYWVYLLSPHEVNVAGTAPTGSVSVTLHQGWNQIGVPSLTAINVSNLTFTNPASGGAISFAQATSSSFRLISSPLYSYNGTSYDAVVAGSQLQPWQAYWIYAFTDVTIQIPTQ